MGEKEIIAGFQKDIRAALAIKTSSGATLQPPHNNWKINRILGVKK
ncbi:MAG: hypothetical protein QG666_20 [Euryarchaeota archaeon]|nr:hypothetical protein [Euryarchaeota archaeon]